MRILILEDNEERIKCFREKFHKHELEITANPEEANNLIAQNEYDFIFLDCDLIDIHYNNEDWLKPDFRDFDENSGIHTAKFLESNADYCKDTVIIVHSLNPVGRKRMMDCLKERIAVEIPYTKLGGMQINECY